MGVAFQLLLVAVDDVDELLIAVDAGCDLVLIVGPDFDLAGLQALVLVLDSSFHEAVGNLAGIPVVLAILLQELLEVTANSFRIAVVMMVEHNLLVAILDSVT